MQIYANVRCESKSLLVLILWRDKIYGRYKIRQISAFYARLRLAYMGGIYGWDIGSILFYFLCTVTFNIPFLEPAT